ncbi:DUF4091 domain-containing protein [Flavisolibacter sp. BT320]|nr:DUF4091 domain-containing protein [Flavisolibacter longurius]
MRILLPLLVLLFSLKVRAQDVSLALQKKPPMNEAERAKEWNDLRTTVNVSFLNSNERYSQDRVPQTSLKNSDTLVGWKGEKLHTQLAIWTKKDLSRVRITVSDLVSKAGTKIKKNNTTAGFVGYVMTDEFRNGCGHRKPQDFDSSLVADPIDESKASVPVKANTVQPIWVSVNIPATTAAGSYTGTITVYAESVYNLQLTVNVLNRTLPPPAKWSFNLDLWQHPAAIARVHKVPLWSKAHFALLKNYYTLLASAGQKNITASIVEEPWGHQTYDDYPSLIKWTKTKDGTWQYDYRLFDRYIAFVMDFGIRSRINCYSMVPWKIAFPYFDEKLGRDTVFRGSIGTPEYNAFWKPMLVDFTRHLKTKGWFAKTAIAMDERPMPAMKAVIKLLKEVDRDWKIALAGDYHPEIQADIYDYCIASRWQFQPDTLDQRKETQKLSTWYTCCTEKYPNGFTFSPPAEHVWIGWYTAAKNMDGYLRWAYNSWPKNPLQDSRFTAWPAGDTYQVYPGPLSSIRFEKLIEGIQDFEKIRLLRDEYRRSGKVDKLQALENALASFNIDKLSHQTAEEMISQVKAFVNPE